MQIKEPPPPGTPEGVNPPPTPTPFELFLDYVGPATVTFFVLAVFYVVLLRATRGSKHRRVVVPLIMVPLVLYALWGLRWMLQG